MFQKDSTIKKRLDTTSLLARRCETVLQELANIYDTDDVLSQKAKDASRTVSSITRHLA